MLNLYYNAGLRSLTPHTVVMTTYFSYHEMVEPNGVSGDRVLLNSLHFVDNLQVPVFLPREALLLVRQLPTHLLPALRAKHGRPPFNHAGVQYQPLLCLVVSDMENLQTGKLYRTKDTHTHLLTHSFLLKLLPDFGIQLLVHFLVVAETRLPSLGGGGLQAAEEELFRWGREEGHLQVLGDGVGGRQLASREDILREGEV